MLAEHVPHGAELTKKLRVDLISGHWVVLEAFSDVWRLAIVVTIAVQILVFLNKRMAPDVLQGDASVGVHLKHTSNEIFRLWTEMLGHLILSSLRFVHHHS